MMSSWTCSRMIMSLEDNDAEELDYDATDGDDGAPQQDNNDSDQALSELNVPAVNIICFIPFNKQHPGTNYAYTKSASI